MTFSKREKYISIAALSVVILAVAYNFAMEPFLKKWDSLDSEIMIKKTRLRKAIKLLEDKNVIINEYNSYAVSFNNSKILNYIEKEALSSGIKTANIRPKPVVQKELYKENIIELQIEGTLPAINKFISKLNNAPLFITVKKFDLRKIEEGPSFFKGTLILSNLII